MLEELKGHLDVSEIKRGYAHLPIYQPCPKCETEMENDLADASNYLSYPGHVDEKHVTYFICHKCEESGEDNFEYEIPIEIVKTEITIKFDKTKIRSA